MSLWAAITDDRVSTWSVPIRDIAIVGHLPRFSSLGWLLTKYIAVKTLIGKPPPHLKKIVTFHSFFFCKEGMKTIPSKCHSKFIEGTNSELGRRRTLSEPKKTSSAGRWIHRAILAVSLSGWLGSQSSTGWSAGAGSWAQRSPMPTMGTIHKTVYDNGLWVALGSGFQADITAKVPAGPILTSKDAITWTVRYAGAFTETLDVHYANGLWVVVGDKNPPVPGWA